jgi:hypothetical protein
MPENPFETPSGLPSRLLGRLGERKRLTDELAAKTRRHVSVIGARLSGKTILLNWAAREYSGNAFVATVYWDLRHGEPKRDEDFYLQLAHLASDRLPPLLGDVASFLRGAATLQEVRLAFEELARLGRRLLIILDGMDGLLQGGTITRNLWDNLRALAELESVVFLTGSRRRLRELCSSPDARTSDFWNIFAPQPIELSALDVAGVRALFMDAGLDLDDTAAAALHEWTGGQPALLGAVGQRLWEAGGSRRLGRSEIDQTARFLATDAQDVLDTLWRDCSAEEQGRLDDLCRDRSVGAGALTPAARQSLQARGFVAVKDNRLSLQCQALAQYVCRLAPTAAEALLLFDQPDRWMVSEARALQFRLGHLRAEGVDEELASHLRLAVENVLTQQVFRRQVRGVNERALSLVWDAELPTRQIPPEWTDGWKRAGLNSAPEGSVPVDPGPQVWLLRLMTNPKKGGKRRSHCITRRTAILIDHLQAAGDFGQHTDGEETSWTVPFCLAVCHSALELAASLIADLRRTAAP